jgi:DNA-directed RNA polymerase subunit K/omega
MGRISKNNSIYAGKKNVDITNIINEKKINNNVNINQLGGNNIKKNTKNKNSVDSDSEFGLNDDDYIEEDEEQNEDEEPNEDEEQNGDEEQNEDIDNDDEDSNEIYSEKSDKESNIEEDENIDEDEKNYIDDDETLKTKCYSKYAKIDYDELDFDELFGDESVLIGKNVRISKPILTKYEFVRLLTDRTKQLAQGAKQMLKNTSELSSKEIAKLEIKIHIMFIKIDFFKNFYF